MYVYIYIPKKQIFKLRERSITDFKYYFFRFRNLDDSIFSQQNDYHFTSFSLMLLAW